MKGTQTITLSQEAIEEAMTDYLNKMIKHDGIIVVGVVNFERDGTLSVDFEDEAITTATSVAAPREDRRNEDPVAGISKEKSSTATTGILQTSGQKVDPPRR